MHRLLDNSKDIIMIYTSWVQSYWYDSIMIYILPKSINRDDLTSSLLTSCYTSAKEVNIDTAEVMH